MPSHLRMDRGGWILTPLPSLEAFSSKLSLPAPCQLVSPPGLAVGLDKVSFFQSILLLPCKGLPLAPPHPFLGTSLLLEKIIGWIANKTCSLPCSIAHIRDFHISPDERQLRVYSCTCCKRQFHSGFSSLDALGELSCPLSKRILCRKLNIQN